MRDKDAIRESMWTALEQAKVVRARNVHDKIPHFHGAEEAAERVFGLAVWQQATVIKSNPDKAQRPLRQRALEEGKVVYMAVPRLRSEQCFVELDPAKLDIAPARASTISGAFRAGRPVYVEEMRPVDLVISGSVAVNRPGVRIGKGGGFADLEFALAVAAGIVRPSTPVISTVHDMQVLDEELPITRHDVPLDYAVTPHETIHCTVNGAGNIPRPGGIYWEDLDDEKISEIPLLRRLREAQKLA
jgi:5-formyltetrahydrofolate cyclo-ligase